MSIKTIFILALMIGLNSLPMLARAESPGGRAKEPIGNAFHMEGRTAVIDQANLTETQFKYLYEGRVDKFTENPYHFQPLESIDSDGIIVTPKIVKNSAVQKQLRKRSDSRRAQ